VLGDEFFPHALVEGFALLSFEIGLDGGSCLQQGGLVSGKGRGYQR